MIQEVAGAFTLDPKLAQDTVPVGQFPLSLLLLSRDSNYPWCILVPRREEVSEIHHLSEEEQIQLVRESCHLAEVMTALFDAHKMNVAALGNVVRQLHVHHIARFTDDLAWPQPIWGAVTSKPYTDAELKSRVEKLQRALVGEDFTPAD